MKKLSLIVALFAVALGTLFVLKAKAGKSVNVVGYYDYTGNEFDAFERIEPSNYIFAGSAPGQTEQCAVGSEVLCGIYVNGNGTNPYITPNSSLETALENNSYWNGVIYYAPMEQ
ncbi:hypothetical protein [uncultured Chitinophaga sp.]|uniref:hypothetical protein n=1 Tax=uncultured Chitinophaga sp. TaxID=339340 RepID=UPI0025E9C394|nr:hypothetical protein [uncultured Chitinophaga sp.]